MIRKLIPFLCMILCAAPLAGCLDMPFIVSSQPFYADDDPGIAVPNMEGGGWTSKDGQQLKLEPDTLTGKPGDYVMTFTTAMLPEPLPDVEQPPVPRDSSKPENNDEMQAHVFEVDGQTYIDISLLQPQMEPLPDKGAQRGNSKDGHILCRLSVGLNQVGLELMDMKWFSEYTAAHRDELGTMLPEPMPDKASTPYVSDSPEKIAAFLKKHDKDGLWGPAVTFSRPE